MLALTLLVASLFQASTRPPEKHLPARVFIFTAEATPGGTPEDRLGRLDSVRDLEDLLGGRKKFVALVRSADEADVLIEVVNREEREAATGGFGGASMTKFSDRIVRIRLKAGDKTSDLKGLAQGSWRAAAKDAAERITKWIGNLYEDRAPKKRPTQPDARVSGAFSVRRSSGRARPASRSRTFRPRPLR